MNLVHTLALIVAIAAPLAVAQSEQGKAIENLYCMTGPYRIALPKSYTNVRSLGPIQSEKVVETHDWGDYKTHLRVLTIEGLEVALITFSNDPHRYVLASAKITSPAWKLAGRLKVGNSAAFAFRDLPTKTIPMDGDVTLDGDADSIQVTLSGGQVKSVIYGCYTG
jgi:hypothetical protein